MRIAGIVLAGGLSRRMGGGDKCLKLLRGEPVLAHIIARASPQVTALALNANGDARRFVAFGLTVVADNVPGFAGPLAGILAGLDWAAALAPPATHVASFAGDAPFLPRNLVARLAEAVARGHELAAARSKGQPHPVFGLWPVTLRNGLRRAMTEEGLRKVDALTARYRLAHVDFPATPLDPFFNLNHPADLAEAERLAAAQ